MPASKPYRSLNRDFVADRAAHKRALLRPFDYPSPGNVHVSPGIDRAHAFYAAALGQKWRVLPINLSDWQVTKIDRPSLGTASVHFERRDAAKALESVVIPLRYLDWQPAPAVASIDKECQPETAQDAAPLHDGIPPSGLAGPQPRESVMSVLETINPFRRKQAARPIDGGDRFEPTRAGITFLETNARTGKTVKGGPGAKARTPDKRNGHKTPPAAKPGNGTPHVAATPPAPPSPPSPPAKYYGEIRTRAGKVKYRTTRSYPTAEEAAAAAFASGPDWAREAITYTGLGLHTR